MKRGNRFRLVVVWKVGGEYTRWAEKPMDFREDIETTNLDACIVEIVSRLMDESLEKGQDGELTIMIRHDRP